MQSVNNKPQFGPWLVQQVHSGEYEGLRWIADGIFRIPWKHNSRKDCGAGDNKIFRAWAVASGKISENPDDKAKWKTNFRCALGCLKNQFRMLDDHSNNMADPHKVYQVLTVERSSASQSAPLVEQSSHFADRMYAHEEMEPNDLLRDIMTLGLNNQQPVQEWNTPYNYQDPIPAQPTQYPIPVTQNTSAVPVEQPYYEVSHDLPSICDLEISIHYRRREMLKTRVSSQFVQLHFNSEMPNFNGQSLSFPTTEGLLDHKQVKYTKRILNSIQRGLLLEVCHTGIYGFRQDKCNVFASTSDPTELQGAEPRKLDPNCRVQLLSYEKYGRDLMDFRENKRGSPEYTLYLCFGEKFPDGRPLERKLILVKVVPLICREFHERAHLDGASSISSSVSLQISHNSLFDLINATFGLPTAE
ncbi:interferon regulatory factor 7 isoform X2 [Denticeps clupeoides]|uniref:interferon regulatory factor 7 isoform X2 n=1 Tax=Denticeps clupeoides TaxID=299321 RepID=UPI0010A32707|nr:interferon regulatory factor 7 isoform X2 [Denticeps clupeoides]